MPFSKGRAHILWSLKKSTNKYQVFTVCVHTVSILVPLWLMIIFLVFFYRSKLFSECLQFDGSFVRGRNNS